MFYVCCALIVLAGYAFSRLLRVYLTAYADELIRRTKENQRG